MILCNACKQPKNLRNLLCKFSIYNVQDNQRQTRRTIAINTKEIPIKIFSNEQSRRKKAGQGNKTFQEIHFVLY